MEDIALSVSLVTPSPKNDGKFKFLLCLCYTALGNPCACSEEVSETA